jgi:hypothetical protein
MTRYTEQSIVVIIEHACAWHVATGEFYTHAQEIGASTCYFYFDLKNRIIDATQAVYFFNLIV